MPHLKFQDQYRTMTRSQVAADMHDLARQLEVGGRLPHGSGTIDVPDRIEREFEIDQTTDGAELTVEVKLKWAAS